MTDENVIQLPLLATSPRPPREERDWITGPELCGDARITYRQLDYWCRTGLLTSMEDPTPGSGHLRRFSEDHTARATAIRELLDAGIALQVIRDHIDEFLEFGHLVMGPITIARNDHQESAS